MSFTYDPRSGNFKGFWMTSDGQLQPFHFRFSSDKEFVFEMVEDFKTNKLVARNKFIFDDPEHISGNHYNASEIEYSTSKWVRTILGR